MTDAQCQSPHARRAVSHRSTQAPRWLWLLACVLAGCAPASIVGASDATLYERRPATWFEELTDGARVSPDGRWALYGTPPRITLIDLATGREDRERLQDGFEQVEHGVFGPQGRLVRLGTRAGVRGWFDGSDTTALSVPADAVPIWSPDGRRVASIRSSTRTGGVIVDERVLPVPGYLLRVAWTPDGATLVTVTRSADYTVAIGALSVATGAFRMIADGLDADVFPAYVAVSPDGREVILSLASDRTPEPRSRHDPNADRDLDLWAVDLSTGAKRLIVEQAGDDFAADMADGHVIWTHADVRPSVVVAPVWGGAVRTLVDRGELPDWSHDGRQVAFTIGGWRLRDVALPLDVYVVDVDGHASPLAPPRPLIVGFHEDFTPAWSPDGRWLAFHSHRAPAPVPSYFSEGSTDDLWLASPGDPAGTERRLTDFGHEAGSASWSPDGRRLAFVSQDRDPPARSRTWIVTIDPVTGVRRDAMRLALPPEIPSTESVSWSPDGVTLAVASSDGPGRQALWLLAVDGGAPARRLTTYASATFGGLDWTPDGRTLIYSALTGARMQLFAIDLAGGAARQLTYSDVNVLQPKVSPDGQWIAATALRHTRRILRRPFTPQFTPAAATR